MRFLGDLAAANLIAEPVAPVDWLRIAELVARYDRRHFTVVRPIGEPFTLLPQGTTASPGGWR